VLLIYYIRYTVLSIRPPWISENSLYQGGMKIYESYGNSFHSSI
jgi:hypothetical protein